MSWNDRLREAAYNSPGGVRQLFDFEDVSRSTEKRTAAFNFPDANGTYIQDLGNAGSQYPIRAFFWGDDYDTEAAAFEALLLEKGVGKLEHPVYGTVDVVPFGAITRRDDLKTAANQAIVEVTFWETTGLIYPTSQNDPGSDVAVAVEEFNAAAAQELDDALDLDTQIERITFKNSYQNLIAVAADGLQAVADTQDSVRQTFESIVSSIDLGIDTLVSDPLSLAFQTTLLIQAPSQAAASIGARLSAYQDLALALISGDGALVTPGYDSREANGFYTSNLFAMSYVTGSVLSTLNNQFETKPDALEAASNVLDLFDQMAAWRDANFESLSAIDTGASYQKLQEAVSLTVGFLVYLSFSLKQERRVVLDRARTIIDLAAELYGSIDENLDFLISSNGLTGSEILELPRGREIVYYV